MEKQNSGKALAVVALLIAVVGLTVGFAAFSSVLNISANANVELSGAEWDVGFASGGTMAPLTGTATSVSGTGVTNAGTVNLLKYTLSQGTSATLDTTAGTSVSYPFQIKNAGSITATLKNITSAGLSCAYNPNAATRTIEQDATPNIGETITAETGTISNADCQTMFEATLTIDGTDYDLNDLTNASYTGKTIAAGSSVNATLTISATGVAPSNTVDGDLVVTLGNTTVNYASK